VRPVITFSACFWNCFWAGFWAGFWAWMLLLPANVAQTTAKSMSVRAGMDLTRRCGIGVFLVFTGLDLIAILDVKSPIAEKALTAAFLWENTMAGEC